MYWFPKLISEMELNSSNKLFLPPESKIWKLVSVYVKLTSTSTVGNRQLCLACQKYNENLFDIVSYNKVFANYEQPASETVEYYFVREMDFNNNLSGTLFIPLPEMYLFRNTFLQIYDVSAIDPTADDMEVILQVLETSSKRY